MYIRLKLPGNLTKQLTTLQRKNFRQCVTRASTYGAEGRLNQTPQPPAHAQCIHNRKLVQNTLLASM